MNSSTISNASLLNSDGMSVVLMDDVSSISVSDIFQGHFHLRLFESLIF